MKAVIAGYARSPFQFARKGALATTRPDELAAQVVRGLLARTDLDPALIEDVILGCSYPEGPQGNNLARIVGFLAGLPPRWRARPSTASADRRCRPSIWLRPISKPAWARHSCASAWNPLARWCRRAASTLPPNPQLKAGTHAYMPMGP